MCATLLTLLLAYLLYTHVLAWQLMSGDEGQSVASSVRLPTGAGQKPPLPPGNVSAERRRWLSAIKVRTCSMPRVNYEHAQVYAHA